MPVKRKSKSQSQGKTKPVKRGTRKKSVSVSGKSKSQTNSSENLNGFPSNYNGFPSNYNGFPSNGDYSGFPIDSVNSSPNNNYGFSASARRRNSANNRAEKFNGFSPSTSIYNTPEGKSPVVSVAGKKKGRGSVKVKKASKSRRSKGKK